MVKENFLLFRKLMIALDLCVIASAFLLNYYLKGFLTGFEQPQIRVFALLITLSVWGFLLYRFDMYSSIRTKEILDIIYIICKAAFFGLLILNGLLFFFKHSQQERNFIALVFLTAAILLGVEKICLMLLLRLLRSKGYNYRNVLIVGFNKRVENFVTIIKETPEWGLKIIGIIDQDSSRIGMAIDGIKVIGSFDTMAQIIHANVVDEVIFILPRSLLGDIEDLIYFCETEGIRVSISADFYNLKIAKAKQSDLHGFPLLVFESTSDKLWQLLMKRTLDVIISAVALITLLPVLLTVAMLIKLISPGPVFFKQEREGLNRRRFNLFKFRSMVADAEDRLKELMMNNEMKGPAFKMRNDPRIIPVIGKFLRRFSIDELPQLWNVLKGDMSLVGPRPPIPSEVNQYANWHRRRLSMRPGITCLWQVNGRNKIVDFNKWTQLDLDYIDNWSIWLDLKILFKTVPVVLFGIGAK